MIKCITELYGNLPFPLTKGQDYALKTITKKEGHYALVGLAGTGKSTILTLLKKFYGNEIIFCATSGVASKGMPDGIGAGTAHSILSLSTEMATPEFIRKLNRTTTALFANSDLIKVIVVDEAFAHDTDKLYTLLRRVERLNKKTSKRKQRNIKIILCGDPLQKPPICKGFQKDWMTEQYGSHLMFKSDLWETYNFETLMLTEVMRQEDKVFKSFLDVIRYGQVERYEKALAWINKRVNPEYDTTLLLLAPTKRIVGHANNLSLDRNPNPKGTWKAVMGGRYNMRDSPLAEEVTLAVGSPVIGIINHEEGDYVNGSYGHVVSIGEDGCEVDFEDSIGITYVERVTLREEETYIEQHVLQEDGSYADEQRKKLIGTCKQLPLLLAAAYTISKSQGKTFTCKLNVDVGDSSLYTSRALGDFGTADVYVGLSRATDVNNITLTRPILPAHIKVCTESVEWWIKMEKIYKEKSSETD